MLKLQQIHHVQITVPLESEIQAKTFYCDILGLKELEKPDILKKNGGFWLELAQQQIHIGVEEGIDRFATKAHIAFQVQNIQLWREHLSAHHIKIKESTAIPGLTRFEFRDPFGNRIEILEVRSYDAY